MKNLEDIAPSISTARWTSDRALRQTFVVKLRHGLHARPCAQLVKVLRPFRSQVDVNVNGHQANGHSIMGLMALAAGPESRLTFTISGTDAPQAMTAVSRLFETDFAQETFSAAI